MRGFQLFQTRCTRLRKTKEGDTAVFASRASLASRAGQEARERSREGRVSLSVLGAVRACVCARRRFLFFRVRKGDGRYY